MLRRRFLQGAAAALGLAAIAPTELLAPAKTYFIPKVPRVALASDLEIRLFTDMHRDWLEKIVGQRTPGDS